MRRTIIGCLAILAMTTLFPLNNLKQSYPPQKNTGKFKRCIFIVLDGLRPDGFFPTHKKNVYTNNFQHNYNSFNYFSRVDDPTLTAPRLEAFFTGKKTNFINSIFAFNHSKSNSDFFKQFNYFYCGDETLENIFGLKGFVYYAYGNQTKTKEEYLSIYKLIKRSIKPTKNNELFIAHLSSIDSIGHRGGIFNVKLKKIMRIYSGLINFLAKNLDEESFIVITSDHGVRENGDHGGTSTEENTSFCSFIFHNSIKFFSPNFFSKEDFSLSNFYKLKNQISTINQNDIVNTICALLGKSYPKETTGGLINEFINPIHKLNLIVQKIGLLKSKKYFLKRLFKELISFKTKLLEVERRLPLEVESEKSKLFESEKRLLENESSRKRLLEAEKRLPLEVESEKSKLFESSKSKLLENESSRKRLLENESSKIQFNKETSFKSHSECGDSSFIQSNTLGNKELMNSESESFNNQFKQRNLENLLFKFNEIEKQVDFALKIVPNIVLAALIAIIIFLLAKVSILHTFLFFMIIHSVYSFLHEDLLLSFFCTKNPFINLVFILISNTPQQKEDRFVQFKMKSPIVWIIIILLINFAKKIKFSKCKPNDTKFSKCNPIDIKLNKCNPIDTKCSKCKPIDFIINQFNEFIALFKVKKVCSTLFLIILRIILSAFNLDLDRSTRIIHLITTLNPLTILYTTNNPINCYFIYHLYNYPNTVLYYYIFVFLMDFNWQMNLNLEFCYFFSDTFDLKITILILFFRLIYPRIILEVPFEQEVINFSIGLIVCVFTYNQMIFAWFFGGRLVLQFIWLMFVCLKVDVLCKKIAGGSKLMVK